MAKHRGNGTSGALPRNALGAALLASTVICLPGPLAGTALAQPAPPAVMVDYAVPAGPLGAAISRFGDRSNLQMLYPADLVRGKRSAGVSGAMSREEALVRILAGTGLSFRFTNANTVTLYDPAEGGAVFPEAADGSMMLDPIDVSGQAVWSTDTPYETPASVAFISAEDIERVPPMRPGDVFDGVPGVLSASKNTGGAIDVNIRGLQGMNRVKVMVDGTQQDTSAYRNYAGFDNRSYFDSELLSGIEIEKGPGTGVYSSGTLGGIVNMRTIGAADVLLDGKSHGMRVRGNIGNNAIDPQLFPFRAPARPEDDASSVPGLANSFGSVSAAARSETFELVAAYARRNQGNYFAGTKDAGSTATLPGEEVPNTSLDSESALVKGLVRWFDGQSLELGYNTYDAEVGYSHPVYMNYFPRVQFPLGKAESRRYTANYKWESERYSWIDLRANLWGADLRSRDPNPTQSSGHLQMDSDSWGTEVWNATRFEAMSMPVVLNYGAEYSSVGINSVNVWENDLGSNPVVDGERNVFGSFVTASVDLASWLNVTAGLRYDSYETTGDAFFPGMGPATSEGSAVLPNVTVTVTPWDGVQVFGRYTEGMRVPSVREIAGEVNFAYMTPNPYLEPEFSENVEFGVNYLRDNLFLEGDKARLKTVYFHNDISNYISRSSDCPVPLPYATCFVNADDALFEGVELSAGYDMGRAFFDVALNYYIDVEINSSGAQWASNYAPPKFTATMTAGLRFLDEKLTVGVTATYVGERSVPFLFAPPYAAVMWTTNVLIADVFASYVVSDAMRLDLSVANIEDRYYVDPLAVTTIPSPGRTARLGFTAKF